MHDLPDRNYNRHTARDMVDYLLEGHDVKLKSLGRDAGYNLLKIIMLAQDMLAADDMDLYCDEFKQEQIELRSPNDETRRRPASLMNVTVHLINPDTED